MHSRRRLSVTSMVAGLALLLAACGGGGTGGTGGQRAEQGEGPDRDRPALPFDQQVLTVGSQPDRYNAEIPERPDLGKYPLNTSVFDTLVRMNEKLQLEPMLAERWTYDQATNTHRFVLRRGVTFHDGAELTADDVKYTFDLVVKADPNNYQELGPDSVKVVDPYTVDITPKKPNFHLHEQILHPIWGINRNGSDPMKPVGTGPFRFVEYVKNDRFVVERYDGYWNNERAAKARRITFKFVADPQARLLALRSGELDLILDVPREATEDLEATPGVKVVRSTVGAYNALFWNIAGQAPHPWGKDPKLREAVALAIDRRTVVREVWGGNAEESVTWVPSPVLGKHKDLVKGSTHDPERAKRILDETGYTVGPDGVRTKDGQRVSLVHQARFPPSDHVPSPELIQAQLKKVGIDTRINMPNDAAVANAERRNGQFDLHQNIGNQNDGNPCFLPDLQFYAKSTSPGNKWVSPGGKTDELIEACRTSTDPDTVARLAAEISHQLVDVEHIIIPLAGIYRIWGLKDDVAGFVPHPSQTNQRWEGVYRAR